MTLLLQGAGRQALTATPAGDPIGDTLRADAQVYYIGDSLLDATGHGNTLINHAGVTFAAGLIGNAFSFDKTQTQYLSCPTSAYLETGSRDFTWAFWVKLKSLPAVGQPMEFIVKTVDDGETYTVEYDVKVFTYAGPETDWVYLSDDGGGRDLSTATNIVASIDFWYFVELQFQYAEPKIVTKARNESNDQKV